MIKKKKQIMVKEQIKTNNESNKEKTNVIKKINY